MIQRVLQWILIFLTITFTGWGATQLSTSTLGYDKLFAALIFIVIIVTWKKVDYKPWTIVVTVGAIFLHTAYLYGNTYAGLPFDKIMHVIGAFALTIMMYQIALQQNIKKNTWLWVLLIVMGIAAFHEIVEFLGYAYLGSGDGIFFFGVGDFGEWNNTMWDLISNVVGAVVGILAIKK